jgi:hypothetical protein
MYSFSLRIVDSCLSLELKSCSRFLSFSIFSSYAFKTEFHRRAAEDAEKDFFVWRRDTAKQKGLCHYGTRIIKDSVLIQKGWSFCSNRRLPIGAEEIFLSDLRGSAVKPNYSLLFILFSNSP